MFLTIYYMIMDQINPNLLVPMVVLITVQTDVCVNPMAKLRPSSPIYGIAYFDVDEAREP